MGRKTGRNEPCPCGSGKKHKKCCGSGAGTAGPPVDPAGLQTVPFEAMPEPVRAAFLQQQFKQAEHERTYGHIRPPIATDFQGYKIVAVGNKLTWAKNWKTFHDFLFTYIAGVLGRDWGNAEIKKPFEPASRTGRAPERAGAR